MEILKVIKIGGNLINNPTLLATFIKHFASIEGPKILVHGGGSLATEMAIKMKMDVKMAEGRRVTDKQTLDVITMVYGGKINKKLVAALQSNACNAIGFSGADGNAIVSVKRPIKHIDYGFVGDVVNVNTELLGLLIKHNVTPVFSALTHDGNGQLLNTNADTVAAELAIAFAKTFQTELYYCFEKKGVLLDVTDENSVIEKINQKKYDAFVENRVIADGMLPKLDNCFYAVHQKVQKVCIGNTDMLYNQHAKFTKIQAT